MDCKCPQCGYTAEQEGNCPTCNVPVVKEEVVSPGEAALSEAKEPEKTE